MSDDVKRLSYLEGAVVVTDVETVDCVSCEEEAVEPEIAKLKLKIAFFFSAKLKSEYFEFVPELPRERW